MPDPPGGLSGRFWDPPAMLEMKSWSSLLQSLSK